MSELLDELYVKDPNCKIGEQKYICAGTGNDCAIATQHFTEFAKFVNELTDTNSDRIFLTVEDNLCIKHECPIYNITMQKITEFAQRKAK